MKVSINQPAYLPWLGYFHRIAASDLHIVMDHVQFEKNSFTNRNKVRTNEGWCWLTVPLQTKGFYGKLAIERVNIVDDDGWRRKHWDTLRMNYAKAPYFSDHAAFFENIYSQKWQRLSDLLKKTTLYLLQTLNITTSIQFSSEMNPQGSKDELVVELCRMADAKLYISGALGRNYLRRELFEREKIRVVYQDYRHPVYPQIHPGFEPGMSVLDLLFNCGPDSHRIIMEGQEAYL